MTRPFPALKCWLVLGLFPAVFEAPAQQLEPRFYANAPVGMNFLITGYGYSDGPVTTDAASPVQGAQVQTHTAVVGYARSFGLGGKSAKFDVAEGLAAFSGQATIAGQSRPREVFGPTDLQARGSINLYGAPALTIKEFADYRQDLIIGMSFLLTAPVGRYDGDKLLNIGTHRWSFKPELGISKVFGPVTLELAPGVTFYTDNDDFVRQVRQQRPLYSVQGHIIYSFGRGIWLAVDGTYYRGGSTTLGGVDQHDALENFRTGATLSLPLGRQMSVKFYGSDGVHARRGANAWLVGMALQYRWGGEL